MESKELERFGLCGVLLALLCAGGCAHQSPTIAHVHVGHAITAVNDTPGDVGYLDLAQQHAEKAVVLADKAVQPNTSLAVLKADVAQINAIVNTEGKYPLTKAVLEAEQHIRYAAQDSPDASENVKEGYRQFAPTIEGVVFRGGLIERYAVDVASLDDEQEARLLALEIRDLVHANLNGEDLDEDGEIGNLPREYGIVQIRSDLDEMVDRENPPYVTVDRWYLFNLIRLPGGQWIFKRGGAGSGSRGY